MDVMQDIPSGERGPISQDMIDKVSTIIDLDRYPLHRPDSRAYHELVTTCREGLKDYGCASLPDFLSPHGLDDVTHESGLLSQDAFFSKSEVNCYFTEDNPELSPGDPRRMFMERTSGFVTRDQFAETSATIAVYTSEIVKRFAADCMRKEVLYEYKDPFAGLVINVVEPGTQQPWHFDTNEFILSLMTQRADEGGLFEYAPNIRSPEGENYQGVADIIRGRDRSAVHTLNLKPGDLQLFTGRYTLHRVTRVSGSRPRLTSIFGYSEDPNVVGRVERTRQLYGRVHQLHIDAERSGERPDGLTD